MRSYYNPRRASMPIRLNLTFDEARILRDFIGWVSDEYLPDEDLRLPDRLMSALKGALSAAESDPKSPWPGGGF